MTAPVVLVIERALVVSFTLTCLLSLLGWLYLFGRGRSPLLKCLRWFVYWDLGTIGSIVVLDLLYIAEVFTLESYLPVRWMVAPLGHTIALSGALIGLLRTGSLAPPAAVPPQDHTASLHNSGEVH